MRKRDARRIQGVVRETGPRPSLTAVREKPMAWTTSMAGVKSTGQGSQHRIRKKTKRSSVSNETQASEWAVNGLRGVNKA